MLPGHHWSVEAKGNVFTVDRRIARRESSRLVYQTVATEQWDVCGQTDGIGIGTETNGHRREKRHRWRHLRPYRGNISRVAKRWASF